MYKITPALKDYSWAGSYISDMLGIKGPVAELWLGTHPNGKNFIGDKPLEDVLGRLPLLVKILSAGKPLSIQVHPDLKRAKEGYRSGRFVDDNHKPEVMYALTDFDVLAGLRPFDKIREDFKRYVPRASKEISFDSIHSFIRTLSDNKTIGYEVMDNSPDFLVRYLHSHFPFDPGIVSPLYLNHIRLKPDDQLYVPPGTLHTYLSGAGIEIQAVSDNTVRLGLTEKKIDIDELLRCVKDIQPLKNHSVFDIQRVNRYHSDGGMEMILSIDGIGKIDDTSLTPASFFITDEPYDLSARNTVFRVKIVPDKIKL